MIQSVEQKSLILIDGVFKALIRLILLSFVKSIDMRCSFYGNTFFFVGEAFIDVEHVYVK